MKNAIENMKTLPTTQSTEFLGCGCVSPKDIYCWSAKYNIYFTNKYSSHNNIELWPN